MKETLHAKRRARTKRRFRAIGTILHALWGEAPPDYALSQKEILAEVETAIVGQRRSKDRKPTSEWDGSNRKLIEAANAYDDDLMRKGSRLPKRRLEGILRWLRLHPDADVREQAASLTPSTLATAIRRARKRELV
jgi:hypothetical protein